MTTTKRKVSVSLDADLVEELEASEEALSAQVNQAIRNELVRRRRQRALSEMLARLNDSYGPVDEELVEQLLQSPALSPRLVLDAEAVSALDNPSSGGFDHVRAALTAANRLGRDVIVTCVTLAELYRGRNRSQIVDAMLSREAGVVLRDTDRSFARLVGGVLVAANAGSELLADAHTVAAAVETGGGVILTSDVADLNRLAAPYPNIQVSMI